MKTPHLLQVMFLLFFIAGTALAQEGPSEFEWPREVQLDKGLVTFYQPQPESFAANILEGRSAISYKPNEGEMVFGAYWFRAFLQTDLDSRTAVLDQVDVLRVKFPDMEDSSKVDKVKRRIEEELEAMKIVMSLDHLIATLDEAGLDTESSKALKNDPPHVYYRRVPTVLVSFDGDPIWKEMKTEKLRIALNTPFFVVQDMISEKYFINGGDYWYVSEEPTADTWEQTNSIPPHVRKFSEENAPQKPEDDEEAEPTRLSPPEILVVTEPSELVVTDGEPKYTPIEGTDLLYVENSDSDIIMDINSQDHYILLAGRWYKAKKLEDDQWTYEEPTELPEDFAKVPADGGMGNIRVSVPGTDEAKDALLEQSIPQTAEVVRADANIEVNFDGDPKFKRVSGTEVSYAENSDKQVLKIGPKFYAVDNGIWFISDYPQGPYEVSDHRPEEVDQLPPDVPVYNTKYVYVYDVTPEVVYVGYLPGYTYSYVYGGVVVYGTGYRYPYWYGSVYYPRPVTYGFSVHYNPYTGWGFSFGISAGGWIGWGYHPYYRPYWGPCGYRTGYRHGYYHGYNRGLAAGYAAGYHSGTRNAYLNQNTGVRRTTARRVDRSNIDRSKVSTKSNNLYADKKGNVFERDDSGNWNQKRNDTRKESQESRSPSTREGTRNRADEGQKTDRGDNDRRANQTKQTQVKDQRQERAPGNTRPQTRQNPSPTNYQTPNRSNHTNRSDLNRSYQNRQRSEQNYNRSSRPSNYNRSRATPTRSAPSRGGGRRR